MNDPKVLDVVALLKDLPDRNLQTGRVATLVEQLDTETFEAEFCDLSGKTTGFCELSRSEFLVLKHEPLLAS
jgi:Domain of unknown function (DUF4926)